MMFDVALPSVLFLFSAASIALCSKLKWRIKRLGGQEVKARDVALFAAFLGVTISVMAYVHRLVLTALFLTALSITTFVLTYALVPRRSIALLPPAAMLTLYFAFRGTDLWSLYLSNAFAIALALLITVYLGSLLKWRSAMALVALFTAVDVVQVFITGHMVAVAHAVIEAELPLLIKMPIIPFVRTEYGFRSVALGAGDLLFAGLLSAKSFERFRRTALLSTVGIAISFFAFEALMLTYGVAALPGTLPILCGWFPFALVKEAKRKAAHNSYN